MKKYLHYVSIPLFAIIGAIIFVNLFAQVDFKLQALQARISVQASTKGYTVLQISPFGEVMARTHKTPLRVNISLENIDMELLGDLLETGTEQDKIVTDANDALAAAIRKFIILTAALGFAGGLFGVFVIGTRNLKELILGGIIGFAIVSLLMLGTYRTFDIDQFQSPEYNGVLKAAPWMIGLAEEAFNTVNTWGKQMRGIAININGLFQRVESLQAMAPGEGEFKILHVSDIHNNPASLEFIDQMVRTFGIDMVIDTGDLSDFGTPLEASLFEGIRKLGVPYVIVPGNHETPAIIQEMKQLPNVLLIENGVLAVKGIRIAGIADPASDSLEYKVNMEELKEFAQILEGSIKGAEKKPDLLAIHNVKLAEKLTGQVPVILSGHDHRFKINFRGDSLFIDAGTSGASGIGALQTDRDIPYSFVLLHFDRSAAGVRLKYTDTITISGKQSGYSLERKIYPQLYETVSEK